MRCPYCGSLDTQVKDSRPTDDSSAIRRRRICPDCGGRFTTFERVQLRELFVLKRSGRRVPFDRDKLEQSVAVALRKRSVEPERVERMINGIVRQLESMGEGEVRSDTVGELVMEGLKGLDDVAYVRFASVYKNFREAKDFEEILVRLASEEPDDDGLDGPAPCPRTRMSLPSPASDHDERFMRLALALGARHLGLTWPNPSVGAVVVDDSGDGAGDHRAGEHAAGRQASCGAGRTRPQPATALGARRFTYRWSPARITADRPLASMRSLIPASHGWFPRSRIPIPGCMATAMPACGMPASRSVSDVSRMMRAGSIAATHARAEGAAGGHREARANDAKDLRGSRHGERLMITGEIANARVHLMRAHADAIMVGIGTVLADDPILDVRLPGS